MKLFRALKLKKKLVGEISILKEKIKNKNSYLEGSLNATKYNVRDLYDELLTKINELIGLKYVINEANREILNNLIVLSEKKALLSFWNEVDVNEGSVKGGGFSNVVEQYSVQIDEVEKEKIIADLQNEINLIQDDIDEYNFMTEIPWDESSEVSL